jgi:predicted nucleic acid-binding protein
MVIVDSDVWSEAFKKKNSRFRSVLALKRLITNNQIVMIGPIRQEVLSGMGDSNQFERIKEALRAFPGYAIDEPIYEMAASCYNLCRSNGIQGSHTDFLICACSIHWKASILTNDKDFARYAKHLPIELYQYAK